MPPTLTRIVRRSLFFSVIVAGIMLVHSAGSAGAPDYPTGYVFLDIDDQPLPFQDHETICEAMRTATIVSEAPTNRGVGGSLKLVLDHHGTRFHAVFRVVNETVYSSSVLKKKKLAYRDSAIFEVAAYLMDQMLGINRIPPAVPRSIEDRDGSVQIWLEGTTPEDVLLREDRLVPPDLAGWRRQKQVMRVFDSLVANTDRNQGNILIDRGWRLWFIDHTRSFGESSKLADADKITTCERRLWTALREIDEAALRRQLEPYLTEKQIARLLQRRIRLIDHIQKQIDENGENAVLFDLEP